jgi:hypothetical protein
MQDYVDRLQAILAKPELTPAEVRDGIISTYVIISRLNQTDGDSDVGLKQDAEGLFSHVDGFMGAIFWERGFDINNPTLEQVAETKIMMDGMTQIYAMPENIQAAFNDIYECLSNKAKGIGAALSAETKALVSLEGSAQTEDTSSEETPPLSEDVPASEVDQIISELPSEMESSWDMAPPPMYPTADATETPSEEETPTEEMPVMPDGETPEIAEVDENESEPVPSEEPPVIPDSATTEIPSDETPSLSDGFEPSQILEEEPPIVSESEPAVAEEAPPLSTGFDPSKILEEEPPAVTESEPPSTEVEPVAEKFDPSKILEEEPLAAIESEQAVAEEAPAAEEFDPGKILEEEPLAAIESEQAVAEEAPAAEEFDPSKILEEETPVVSDNDSPKDEEEQSTADEFDPSKILEEESAVVSETDSPSVVDELPTADEFDSAKIVEEPSVVTEGDTIEEQLEEPMASGFDSGVIETEESVVSSEPDVPSAPDETRAMESGETAKPEEPSGQAWGYEVITPATEAPKAVDATEVEAPVAETTVKKTAKKRGRPKKVKKVVKKKAKKRGRPRKKVVDAKDKPKRKRNIKAKNLKIDLSGISIPDDYMAEDPFARAHKEEPELETPMPTDIPPIEEPTGFATEEPEPSTAAASEPDLLDADTAFEDDYSREIGEMESETPTHSAAAEMPLDSELSELGIETPTVEETASFELPSMDTNPEPAAEEVASTEEPSIDVSGFTSLDDTPDTPEESKEVDLTDRETSSELGAILEEPDDIPAIPDFGVPAVDSAAETPEPLTLDEEDATAAESEFSEDIQESEETVSMEGVASEFSDGTSFAERLEEEPSPESSPSSWTELQNEPVEGDTPMNQEMPSESYSEPDSGTEFEDTPVSNAEITSEIPPRKGGSPLLAILALVLGLALGGGASYYWFGVQQAKVVNEKIQNLEKQVEESKQVQEELAASRAEAQALSAIINGQMEASKLPVPKPQYYKTGKGAIVYWVDNSSVRRKYFFYRGKGKKGELKKIGAKAVAKNMLRFRKVSRGTWRYAVTAVDLEGNETEKSEILSLKFPLKK